MTEGTWLPQPSHEVFSACGELVSICVPVGWAEEIEMEMGGGVYVLHVLQVAFLHIFAGGFRMSGGI
jgi:hypothetical protein